MAKVGQGQPEKTLRGRGSGGRLTWIEKKVGKKKKKERKKERRKWEPANSHKESKEPPQRESEPILPSTKTLRFAQGVP